MNKACKFSHSGSLMLFKVDALEQEAFEVLRVVRAIKNTFAPINRIPPEILSLIPDYYEEDEDVKSNTDENSIVLTHVCRRWRAIFTSRPSLWTQLDFTNVDKTSTCIERSKSSLLNLHLRPSKVVDKAFSLLTPHFHRLRSLFFDAYDHPLNLLKRFIDHATLLEKLEINCVSDVEFNGALFSGDLSSLRELHLWRLVVPHFPWKNMANLQVVNLSYDFHSFGTAQMLDFFESAPLLHTVLLWYPMPDSSDAPTERTVSLPRLKIFAINEVPTHSVLLHHLQIPFKTSLTSSFRLNNSPFPAYLPVGFPNLGNMSQITTINLHFESNEEKHVRLSGPSGSLFIHISLSHGQSVGASMADRRIFRSLDPVISTIRRLMVSKYRYKYRGRAGIEKCPIFKTLSLMDELRTLILVDCKDQRFIQALDPQKHPSDLVLCPKMEELVLFIGSQGHFCAGRFARVMKNRAWRGARLASITVVDLGNVAREEEVLKLREHVTNVEYRVSKVLPPWDEIPGESGDVA